MLDQIAHKSDVRTIVVGVRMAFATQINAYAMTNIMDLTVHRNVVRMIVVLMADAYRESAIA